MKSKGVNLVYKREKRKKAKWMETGTGNRYTSERKQMKGAGEKEHLLLIFWEKQNCIFTIQISYFGVFYLFTGLKISQFTSFNL